MDWLRLQLREDEDVWIKSLTSDQTILNLPSRATSWSWIFAEIAFLSGSSRFHPMIQASQKSGVSSRGKISGPTGIAKLALLDPRYSSQLSFNKPKTVPLWLFGLHPKRNGAIP